MLKSCDNCLKKINKKCSCWISVSGKDNPNVCRSYVCAEQLKPATNADKIRAMSGEELARLILYKNLKDKSISYYCENSCKWLKKGKCVLRNESLCPGNHGDNETLLNIILEWLKSESKENEDDF